MLRIELLQSSLVVANVSSLQSPLCMSLQSISMLEDFLKSLSTNFANVNLGLTDGNSTFLHTLSRQ